MQLALFVLKMSQLSSLMKRFYTPRFYIQLFWNNCRMTTVCGQSRNADFTLHGFVFGSLNDVVCLLRKPCRGLPGIILKWFAVAFFGSFSLQYFKGKVSRWTSIGAVLLLVQLSRMINANMSWKNLLVAESIKICSVAIKMTIGLVWHAASESSKVKMGPDLMPSRNEDCRGCRIEIRERNAVVDVVYSRCLKQFF